MDGRQGPPHHGWMSSSSTAPGTSISSRGEARTRSWVISRIATAPWRSTQPRNVPSRARTRQRSSRCPGRGAAPRAAPAPPPPLRAAPSRRIRPCRRIGGVPRTPRGTASAGPTSVGSAPRPNGRSGPRRRRHRTTEPPAGPTGPMRIARGSLPLIPWTGWGPGSHRGPLQSELVLEDSVDSRARHPSDQETLRQVEDTLSVSLGSVNLPLPPPPARLLPPPPWLPSRAPPPIAGTGRWDTPRPTGRWIRGTPGRSRTRWVRTPWDRPRALPGPRSRRDSNPGGGPPRPWRPAPPLAHPPAPRDPPPGPGEGLSPAPSPRPGRAPAERVPRVRRSRSVGSRRCPTPRPTGRWPPGAHTPPRPGRTAVRTVSRSPWGPRWVARGGSSGSPVPMADRRFGIRIPASRAGTRSAVSRAWAPVFFSAVPALRRVGSGDLVVVQGLRG